ncbi:hypothetical protein A2U01_0082933, partial [Trifolium medium]|nr:hypothetical protein [Trifolium medium]
VARRADYPCASRKPQKIRQEQDNIFARRADYPARCAGHRNEQARLSKAGAPRSMNLRAAQPPATHVENAILLE